MIATATLDNIFAWLVQVSVIASLGALLPAVLRIRHPKSQLAYYYAILMLCFALPFVQPWRHKLLFVTRSEAAAPAMPEIPWTTLILGIAALGVMAKLLWLGFGLWQIRRYRASAIPLYPIPQSIRDARLFTGTNALFCVSKDVAGPATMGYFDPIVLLPASFLSFDDDAQRSVACHELLHVRRRDWLMTLLEEVAGSLLWFHPAAWWLINRIRLTREQIVDAEVVRMNPPEPYMEALLSMAVVSKPRLALPAAPFFTEGHLAHRVRALLDSPRRSWTRLCIAYASTALVLFLAGWTTLILFPLTGGAQVVTPRLQRLPLRPIADSAKRLIEPQKERRTFNVALPPPEDGSRDVIHFVNVGTPDPAAEGEFELAFVPPPPPPPGPLGGMFIQGVRALRPGAVASPEDVRNFIASFPPQAVVEVIQAEDGTIHRVMITRSLSNATTFNPVGTNGAFYGLVGPAPATAPTNGEH